MFDDSDVGADVILLGCPQSCMSNPVLDILEVYEDMVEVLLVLEIFLTEFQGATDALPCHISIFLYACESWNLTAEMQRRIRAMGMRCYRKILHVSYKDHVTNEEVYAKIQKAIGPHEDLLTTVKRSRLQWNGHVFCSSGLAKTILQGQAREEDKADRGIGGKTT